MLLALNLLFSIVGIVSFVLFIIVLINSFKHGGILKGILGLITCGLFTFIWGWIQHKKLKMTKIMATWTILTLLGMAGSGTVLAMGISSLMMLPQYLQGIPGMENLKLPNQESKKSTPKINWAKKNSKMNTAKKPGMQKASSPSNGQNVDWSQKAVALRQGDKYTDPNKAISYWSRAISSNQNTAAAYSNRGLAYHELKQYQKAVQDYGQAIKLNPTHAAAYNNRGNSYYEMNQYQLALNDFNHSLKLKPKYARAHMNRGLVYYQMNKTAQACKDFQRSCDQGDCEAMKWAMKNKICR